MRQNSMKNEIEAIREAKAILKLRMMTNHQQAA